MFSLFILLALGTSTGFTELLQKGLHELQRGEIQAAQADLQSASKLEPKNPYVWTALAEVYLRANDPSSAAAAASKAEETGRGNAAIDHGLAMYFAKTQQFGKAAAAEERYAQSAKGNAAAETRAAAWYLAANDKERALPLAKQAAQSDRESGVELAQLFMRGQDFAGAAEVVGNGLTSFPDDPRLTLALGVARYGQRRFTDAIEAFIRVVQLDPEMGQPYTFLGKMLDQAGTHLPAIAEFTSLWAQKHPEDAQAQLVLAKVLLVQSPDCEKCEALLRRSVQLGESDWEAHYQLGLLLERKHQYVPAAAELKRAAELAPRQPMPHYHLARVYDRIGDHERAATERSLHQQLVAPTEGK